MLPIASRPPSNGPNELASPSTYGGLKRQLSDDALIEITGLIAFQNLSSKLNAALVAPRRA